MVGVRPAGVMYHYLESEVILSTMIYSLSHILCIVDISNFKRISDGTLMVIVHNNLLNLAVKKTPKKAWGLAKSLCSLHSQWKPNHRLFPQAFAVTVGSLHNGCRYLSDLYMLNIQWNHFICMLWWYRFVSFSVSRVSYIPKFLGVREGFTTI